MTATQSQTKTEAALDQAHQAAVEIASGQPGRTGQRWLGWICLAALIGFIADTTIVETGVVFHGFDQPVAQWVQSVPWGPLTYLMTLTNTTAGWVQDIFGAAVVVAMFRWERRAGWLMALGALGSAIDQIAKFTVGRARPTADILQILDPSHGYSYPSGGPPFTTSLRSPYQGIAQKVKESARMDR